MTKNISFDLSRTINNYCAGILAFGVGYKFLISPALKNNDFPLFELFIVLCISYFAWKISDILISQVNKLFQSRYIREILTGLLLVLYFLLFGILQDFPDQNDVLPEVEVSVSFQNSPEPLDEENLNESTLNTIEENMLIYLENYIARKLNTYKGDQNIKILSELKHSSYFTRINDNKIGIININWLEKMRAIYAFGIKDNSMYNVTCIGSSLTHISVSHGVCADKIREVFPKQGG